MDFAKNRRKKWYKEKTKLQKLLIRIFTPARYGFCYAHDEKEFNHITTYKECFWCTHHRKLNKRVAREGTQLNNTLNMEDINEYNETMVARNLIHNHTIGGLRDNTDLDNAKYHAKISIGFVNDILTNIKGTSEDKIKFLDKLSKEIPKFTGKKPEKNDR